jgi:4-amino-4-deoxy-L-arabinose transferase-like glycosyltransferase
LNDFLQFRWRKDLWAAGATVSASLICLFGNLGAIGLVGPDEPRYVWIARAMATTGDWVTPRLYGQPWFEKPILYYWAAAFGFVLRFPAEWAARMPSAVAALAAAIAVGWLGWKHYGDEGGFATCPALLAPLMFSASVAGVAFARAATPDMLFSASLALAMACAAGVLRHSNALRVSPLEAQRAPERGTKYLIFFGVFLGLGVLAKGPAAILLAAGAIGLWALATRQWRAALRLAHPFAIGALCLVALPWYVLCALRNPDFLHVFIFEHNFQRYLTPVFQHVQPFWFFLPVTIAALSPWPVLLIPAAREGLRLWREKVCATSPGFFFACWAFFPILFFSFSHSKLPSYILPSVPPLALLCSISAARRLRKSRAMSLLLASGMAFVWLVAAVAILHYVARLPQAMLDEAPLLLTAKLLFAIALAVSGALITCAYRRKLAVAIAICALTAVAAVIFTNVRVLPALDPFFSARWHRSFLALDQHPERIFTYRLKRSWNYGLAFYFGRELPEWSPGDPDPALVLTSSDGLHEMEQHGRFRGTLDESSQGIIYVPVFPAPRNR